MKRLISIAIVLIAAAGIFLRVYPSMTFKDTGPDELFYSHFVNQTTEHGLFAYPAIVKAYVEHQKNPERRLILPPLRITFISAAHAWRAVSGSTSLQATHAIACAASIATLFLAGAFAYRLGGPTIGLGVFALMAFAPMQIYSAQRALIDGFFALWALLCLWSLWENLQKPNDRRWLAIYALSLAAMVATKENAFFVYVALCGILVVQYFVKFGRATMPLYVATVAAPAAAVLLLVLASGGVSEFIDVYRTNVAKSVVAPYAIETGDGPWHRYLVDLALLEPALVLLAVGAMFRLNLAEKPALYLALFVGITYAIMCQVRYGMNLRYANIWDMPLRWLVMWHLTLLTAQLSPRPRMLVIGGVVAALCFLGWQQYHFFFVEAGIYDPVPEALGGALNILK